MPFALVFIGLILIVTGAKDTYSAFGKQVVSDFTGPGNFTFWLASLGAVGALGYISPLRKFSTAFMALIIVAMVLANGNPKASGGGFFQKIQDFLKTGPTGTNAAPTTSADNAATNSVSTADVVSTAAKFAAFI